MPRWLMEVSMVEPLGPDLYAHLVNELYDVPPHKRRNARWVMNSEWFTEVSHLADPMGQSRSIDGLEFLLGKPIEVREDGGVPHLEETWKRPAPDHGP